MTAPADDVHTMTGSTGPSRAPGGACADLDELLLRRYSCRAFAPNPVPDGLIWEIFSLAQRAASWCNTQPWQVHLLSRNALARLSTVLRERASSGPPCPDLPLPEAYVGVYLERRRAAGFGLYNALGIAREDRQARAGQLMENYSFFGAPHAAIITTDRHQGVYGAIDCGGYVSTMMLAAQSRGVACIAQGAIAQYSDVVRDFLDLPDDRLVVCAVALGFPDADHPANGFRTERADVRDVVRMLDE